MDLLKLASQHLGEKLKLDLDGDGVPENLSDALGSLFGSASSAGGDSGIDLSAIVEKMKTSSGEFQKMASSWLGDGENVPISKEQITEMFSSEHIVEFASKLGVSTDAASDALSDVLPKIVDTASSAGSLLDSLVDQVSDNTGGFMNMVKNLFK